MVVVVAAQGVLAAEKGAADAAVGAVVHAHVGFIDQFFPGSRHGSLLGQLGCREGAWPVRELIAVVPKLLCCLGFLPSKNSCRAVKLAPQGVRIGS